jgi:hypothetical protein
MKTKVTFLFLTLLCGFTATAQVIVRDGDLLGNTTYNWTADNEYILDGLVYLEAGGVLNIEAGTVIKGASMITTGDNTSALIIARGAQIFARGTAAAPIIFTAEDDVLTDNGDFTAQDRGEWGGLIVLGSAIIARPDGEDGIEGIDADEPRAKFGGDDNEDNSGVLNYISIRHGGAQLSPNNEINGLTLGGVGAGTEIDYVEVFANLDDGIEFFGGTVNIKHASVAFCGDDGFDYDFGWRGKGQFWFALQGPATGTGRSGEHDGAKPDELAPFSNPTIYNATYIGVGKDAMPVGGDAAKAFPVSVLFRDNAGGTYANSVFTDFNGHAIAVEDRDDTNDGDSFARLAAGDLSLTGNVFENFGAGNTAADLFVAFDTDDMPVAASNAAVATAIGDVNTIGATSIAGISRTTDGGLDPRLNADSEILGGATPSEDVFFNVVTYKGAFGNTVNWLSGWTALSEYGFLGDLVTPINTSDCTVITDSDLIGGETYNWNGGCYTLDGLVFLEADATLNIGAGTVVRGLGANDVSTGDNTSALIITRGATINAIGTAEEPIIFTASEDDLDDDEDFTFQDRGEWGGLIVLGSATIARPDGEDGVEGIDADEARAKFGGGMNPVDDENSGTIKYVSIRHGGAQLSPNNEINGLTLGGVGSGTTIDYVEVFANLDDGIELFGGTVNVTHAATAFCGDDAYDYDFGWRGNGQFWFSLQSPEVSTGRAGEHDGAKPDELAPFSNPTIYNATYVGVGMDATPVGGDAAKALPLAVLFRDNAGGTYANSVFTDYNGAAIAIEDRDDTADGDSYARLQAGDLTVKNNLFFDFGRGATAADIFLAVDADETVNTTSSAVVLANFTAAGNQLVDPELNNAERSEMFDPRPFAFGAAATGAPAATETGIEVVDYYGAFAPGNGGGSDANWLNGWSAISKSSAIFDFVNGVGQVVEEGFLLDAPVPNPAANQTRINFELPRAAEVTISIMDMLGRSMGQFTQRYTAGAQGQDIDESRLANGNYVVILNAEGSRLAQKLVVNK